MEIRFDGKRALVTGAGKGIGWGIAVRLVECGAEVIAVSRTQSDLDELKNTHPGIKTICLDIGNWENTKAALEDIGPVHLLVNNAAIYGMREFGDIVEEEFDKLYNVNVKAIINITQIIAKGMKERGEGGSIVNISSVAAFRAFPGAGFSGSSKAAVDQLTRSMAAELGPYNIRANSVNIGAIRTKIVDQYFNPSQNELAKAMQEKTPLRKFGEVDEAVYPILFLLSDKAAMITGVSMPVDGGISL